MQNLRPFFSLGLFGALVTLLFGGWSAVIVCLVVGAVVGLRIHQQTKSRKPAEVGRSAIQPALAAGVAVVLGGVLYTFVLRPLSGKEAEYTIFFNLPGSSTALSSLLVLFIASTLGLALSAGAGYFVASRQTMPARQGRQQLIIALAVVGILFPLFEQATGLNWMAAFITIQIYILLALGLNIVVGYAGLLDLGYAAFFAIGAYTTGLLNSPQLGIHWNFWLVIWIAAAVAAVAGLVLGAPTLPLRGDYLAIVTLGFGEIVPIVFRNLISVTIREPLSGVVLGLGAFFSKLASNSGGGQALFSGISAELFRGYCLIGCDPVVEARMACFYSCEGPLNVTAGEKGMNPIGQPKLPFLPDNTFGSSSYLPWYLLVLALILFSVFLIRRLRDSRLGRAWMALREDELAASQMGIDPVKTKLLAFSMGATFSGFAGAFYGAYISAIFPSVFDFSVSVIILCMVILGGLGNMTGVIIGAFLIMGTDRLLLPQIASLLKGIMNTTVLPNVANPVLNDFLATSVDPLQMRLALFGIVLVVMMLVRPEGLVPSAERKAELHADAEPTDDVLAEASA